MGACKDLVLQLIAYETGELRGREMLELFSFLIKHRIFLNRSHNRVINRLMASNFISANGDINYERIKKLGINLESSIA